MPSIPILTDQLGIIAVMILQRMNTSKLKRERKAAFNEMVKLLRLSRIIPADATIHQIAEGVDSLGTPIILVRFEESRS